jgi:lysophospholipase L1-like esterase
MRKPNRWLIFSVLVLVFIAITGLPGRWLSSFTGNPQSEPAACQGNNIAFIGGAGASESAARYANRVGQWFINTCGDRIQIKNISIGGTGSDFAAYRLAHDLDGFVPDVAFYEFAVNDKGKHEAYIRQYVEALIYKLRKINPEILLFCVLTTDARDERAYQQGQLPASAAMHQRIAEENGIPVINVGQVLWDTAGEKNLEIQAYLPDGVHPNDAGHQLYADTLLSFLAEYFENDAQQVKGKTSTYSGEYAKAALMDMSVAATSTCEKIVDEDEIHLLCRGGDAFSGQFKGNMLGIVGSIRPDGGRLACVVDGSLEKTVDFWDAYAMHAARTGYFFLFDDLEKSRHTVTCTVTDEIITSGNAASQGNTVKIEYWMINP